MWQWLKTRLAQFGRGGKHYAAPHDEDEKRKAQERLSKIEREFAIIVANMHHTDERFDQR